MRVDELFSSIRCCRFDRKSGRENDRRHNLGVCDGDRDALANSKHNGHLLAVHKSDEICLNRKREQWTDNRTRLVAVLDIQKLEPNSLELDNPEPDSLLQGLDSQELDNLELQ